MKKKLLTLVTSAAMMITLLAAPAMASPGAAFDYDDIKGSTTKLEKYLVMPADAQTPAVKFTYTMSAPTADITATNTELAVKAGPTPAKVKIAESTSTTEAFGDLSFAAGEAGQIATDTTPGTDKVDAGKKYVKKDINLDFSEVEFTEPGVYRYYIQETRKTGETAPPIALDTKVEGSANTWRTIDVYVENKDDGEKVVSYARFDDPTVVISIAEYNALQADDKNLYVPVKEVQPVLLITAFVAYEGKQEAGPKSETTTQATSTEWTAGTIANAGTPNGKEVANAEKNNAYVNELETHDLVIRKNVTGNQGSKDQYFEFTVNVTGAGAGTILDLDTTNTDLSTTKTPATQFAKAAMDAANTKDQNDTLAGQQIVCGADGSAEFKIYLQHGDSVIVKGIPKGASYTVIETEENGYRTSNKANDEEKSGPQDWDYGATSGDFVKDVNGNFYKKTATAPAEAAEYITKDAYGALSDPDKENYDSQTSYTQEVDLTFTNEKSGVIPTGVAFGIGGVVILGGIAVLYFVLRRRFAR